MSFLDTIRTPINKYLISASKEAVLYIANKTSTDFAIENAYLLVPKKDVLHVGVVGKTSFQQSCCL